MSEPEPGAKTAHPVDLQVGRNLRAARKRVGLSQIELATGLGLSFQQVQKYERGQNRISASKLYEATEMLGLKIEDLYAGLPEHGEVRPYAHREPVLAALEASECGLELAGAFLQIRSRRIRRLAADLVTELAAAGAELDDAPDVD